MKEWKDNLAFHAHRTNTHRNELQDASCCSFVPEIYCVQRKNLANNSVLIQMEYNNDTSIVNTTLT